MHCFEACLLLDHVCISVYEELGTMRVNTLLRKIPDDVPCEDESAEAK